MCLAFVIKPSIKGFNASEARKVVSKTSAPRFSFKNAEIKARNAPLKVLKSKARVIFNGAGSKTGFVKIRQAM